MISNKVPGRSLHTCGGFSELASECLFVLELFPWCLLPLYVWATFTPREK